MKYSSLNIDELDALDAKILTAVSENGRMSITELSALIGLSKTPCAARLKKLETDGYILGYRAVLDPVKLGLDHIAFVEVKLSDTRADALNNFNLAIGKVPEIEQCHMIAGGFDYLLKIRTRNIQHYRAFLGDTISALPHVAQTSTYVVMEAVKDTAIID